jgi:hypothetical protein
MPEILSDKVATFPSTLSDWAVAAALNSPDSQTYGTKRQIVATTEIARILLLTGTTAKLKRFVQWTDLSDPTKQALAEACVVTLDMVRDLPDVRTNQPAVYAAIASISQQLVDGGLMAASTRTKLLNLADTAQSWADVNNNGEPVTVQAVERARRGA